MDASTKVSVIKAVEYAKAQMSARIDELEGFLDVRDYSPAQRSNLERKLAGYKEDLKEFKSIKL